MTDIDKHSSLLRYVSSRAYKVLWHRSQYIDLLKGLSLFYNRYHTHGMLRAAKPGNPYWKGRLNTIDLRVLTSLNEFYAENIINFCFKTSYFNEGVNCSEISPSVRVPWLNHWYICCLWNRKINWEQWEAINHKQITRWQHVSRLKASSFGSW